MKLKGRRFETVSDIQRESQAVLDSIKENDSTALLKRRKKRWDRCVRSQGDYTEEMAAKSELSQHFFYLVRELSDSIYIYKHGV
jgi:hypothetical protein